MRSHKHQSLAKLLTESPTLVPTLIRDLLGLDVPDDFEVLSSPETDIEQLDTWLTRAVTAESVDAIIDT